MVAIMSRAWGAEACARLLNKPQKTPTGWKACCPAHDDRNPSLFLADGKDGLALVCYAGCEYRNIVQALEARGAQLSRKSEGIPDSLRGLGEYHQFWDYRDAHGTVIMRVCRWNKGGKKEIRPLLRGIEGWEWKYHPNPRPLFQLDRLANELEKPVIVVEGEKTAHAAQRLFPEYIATTWSGGAQSMGQTDWSPLKGRALTLIPDCDTPGRKAMEWVRQNVAALSASVRIVDPAEKAGAPLPEGWDLADALQEDRPVAGWLDVEKQASRLKRLSEIIAEPTRPQWLIRDVIEQGVIAVLLGPRGTYKSFIAIHWAMSIATEGMPVVIVSAEGRGIDRRFRAWLRRHAPSVKPHNLPVYALEQRVDFTSQEAIAAICADIDAMELPPVLIIIDTLSKNSGGMDENSNSEAKAFIGNLDVHLKRRYAATVLLVHHTGHVEKGRARGASALEADTDAAYVIARVPGGREVTVSRERFKDSGDLPPLAYRADVVDLGEIDDDDRPVTSLVLVPVDPSTVEAEARGRQPRGLRQRELLSTLKELQSKSESALIWGPPELRRIARELGMKKQSAQDTCAAVAQFYLTACVGGYRLPDRTHSKKSESPVSDSSDLIGPRSEKPAEPVSDRPDSDPLNGPEAVH